MERLIHQTMPAPITSAIPNKMALAHKIRRSLRLMTGAIAAFGPFLFGVGLTMMSPTAFYTIGAVWAVMCIAITWWRYARPGAPKKS